MSKIWCESCGASTESGITTIKFCASCGRPFGSSFKSTPPKPSVTISSTNTSDDEPVEVPELDKLDIEIKVDKDDKVTFGQEFQRGKIGITREKVSRPYIKPSKKKKNVQEFLAQQIAQKSAQTKDISDN
ncbi:MAG: hypothetical protein AABY22_10015 [Nanoarchaeota archaeon]